MERQSSGPSGPEEDGKDSDDSSIEEIERGGPAGGTGAEEATTDLDDFLLLLDDDDGDGGDGGLSSIDPRSLALFADVVFDATGEGQDEDEEDDENEASDDDDDDDDPFYSDSYRGPGAIAAASPFAGGCLRLLRALAASGELSARCRAVATAVIERVNAADYTAWKLRWDCSRALWERSRRASSPSPAASAPLAPPSPLSSFLAEEARLCARVAARSGFKNYQLWNHRAKIIAEAVEEEEGGGSRSGGCDGGDDTAAAAVATEAALRVAEGELSFASAALAADAKNYHAWSHRCLVAGLVRSVAVWAREREVAGEAIGEDPASNSAWAHRAAAVGALVELSRFSSSSSSASSPSAAAAAASPSAMLEEEFALASRHARERPHEAGPAWAHARAVAGWKEEASAAEAAAATAEAGNDNRNERPSRHLPLPLASDPRYASLAAEVLQSHPGCVPALLLLHDSHALRALWAAAAAAEAASKAGGGGAGEEAAKAASEAASSEAARCRARLAEVDPTRRGLWLSIG